MHASPVSDVSINFLWNDALGNTHSCINSVNSPTRLRASIAPGATINNYFDVVVTRLAACRSTGRAYHFEVVDNGSIISSTSARTAFIGTCEGRTCRPAHGPSEKLVSQNRNSVLTVSGATSINVGSTQTYTVTSSTATGGYEQLENLSWFTGSIFDLLNVACTYSAPTGATNDRIYADACGWNPTTRACDPTKYDFRAYCWVHTLTATQLPAAVRRRQSRRRHIVHVHSQDRWSGHDQVGNAHLRFFRQFVPLQQVKSTRSRRGREALTSPLAEILAIQSLRSQSLLSASLMP